MIGASEWNLVFGAFAVQRILTVFAAVFKYDSDISSIGMPVGVKANRGTQKKEIKWKELYF